MGVGPRDADRLTLAEMRLLVRAWNEIHSDGKDETPPPPPTDDDYFELLELNDNVARP